MTKKELMVKAHEMTREIKSQYPEVDYKFQLGLCLSYLQEKEGENKMVELKGSEKQVKWALQIKEDMKKQAEKRLKSFSKLSNPKAIEWCENLKRFLVDIEKEESAKWFIDNETRNPGTYSRDWR